LNRSQPKDIAMPETFLNYISGNWLESTAKKAFPNTNPADTDPVVGLFQASGVEDAENACGGAQAAWRALPPVRSEANTFSRRRRSWIAGRENRRREEIDKTESAQLLCGGKRLAGGAYDKGYFVEPTMFAPGMRIA
jgi:acyl-CoA reductase-like NAD-dependent aldehyde dehydrogenase